ncbi:hypothetical protein BCR43DRAFT_499435 [Syncephalastrum racemosum]|uniref:Uncharacterized protein n=1 Tax=Syncephalastrum racemosum TaxID=13706 RepID=A0A1X2H0D3_SYNRA|nr:hypothetical protein BCR43DRAFT_499435 [Syncephalastrum racemosum]
MKTQTLTRFSLFLLVLFLAMAQPAMAADCYCKKIDPEYTEDCCLGTGGDLRKDVATHCIFTQYTHLGNFERCCDSYWGKGHCVRFPHLEEPLE